MMYLQTCALPLISALYFAVVANANCFRPNGTDNADLNDNARGRVLQECENTHMCCWDDQTCLPNLLCMEKETGAVTREYCQSADWPEGECSQLCMELEIFGPIDKMTIDNVQGVWVHVCEDGSSCCGFKDDCCQKQNRFLINNKGERIELPEEMLGGKKTTSKSTSSSATSSTQIPTSATPASNPSTTEGLITQQIQDQNSDEMNYKQGLGTGAKAGIGAGVGAAVLIAAVALFFLFRERRKRLQGQAPITGQVVMPYGLESRAELDMRNAVYPMKHKTEDPNATELPAGEARIREMY